MRLDKYLADMGMGTRSELKKIIKSGQVTVDGSVVRDPGFKVVTDTSVEMNGEPVIYEEYEYYMLNKPAGVISASEDPRERTVVDLIEDASRRDLFPVGRLDRDTEGLLLITNDGALAHRLLSPKHHVDKTYYAQVRGTITEDVVREFREGLLLPDGLKCMPAELLILPSANTVFSDNTAFFNNTAFSDNSTEVLVTIHEGKFHQIKRMFLAVGSEVLYLKRISMGPLSLDAELEPGQYRRLTDAEILELRNI